MSLSTTLIIIVAAVITATIITAIMVIDLCFYIKIWQEKGWHLMPGCGFLGYLLEQTVKRHRKNKEKIYEYKRCSKFYKK